MKIRLNAAQIGGAVTVPPSKSMAHRSFLAAALASGTTTITNVAYSMDMEATLGAVEQFGAKIVRHKDSVEITGNGGIFAAPTTDVNCVESGSTLRFLIPLFTLCGCDVTFVGQGRLMQRPQEIYQQLFAEKGVSFVQTENKITVNGALTAGDYTLNGGVSSQFITGLLYTLPLLNADSTITITPPFESRSYVNLTIQVLADFGIAVQWLNDNQLFVKGGQKYKSPAQYRVEGDCSQAAFFAVLGAITGGITLKDVRANTLQGDYVIFDILKRAGAQFVVQNGDFIFSKSELTACEIDLADCPDLGPVLMVLGLFCNGTTVIKNAGRLRVKESDRIQAMHSEITKLGGKMRVDGDTIFVTGGSVSGAEDLASSNDHRIVMALAVASMASGQTISIQQAEAINKSYPNFFEHAADVGASVTKL